MTKLRNIIVDNADSNPVPVTGSVTTNSADGDIQETENLTNTELLQEIVVQLKLIRMHQEIASSEVIEKQDIEED